MRKYLLDRPSRSIIVFDGDLPPPQGLGERNQHLLTGVVPDAHLMGRAPFNWGPQSSLVGRYEAAQALLIDTLEYYDIERGVTDETLQVGASLAPIFAKPYAEHVLLGITAPQQMILAEDVLYWLADQGIQGLEHAERRTAQAVLTYIVNLILHKEVVRERHIRAVTVPSVGDDHYTSPASP